MCVCVYMRVVNINIFFLATNYLVSVVSPMSNVLIHKCPILTL